MFIPIQCEYYALEGVSQLVRIIDLVQTQLNPALLVTTVLLTMYDARTRLSAQVADEVRNALRARRCSGQRSRGRSGSPRRRATGSPS